MSKFLKAWLLISSLLPVSYFAYKSYKTEESVFLQNTDRQVVFLNSDFKFDHHKDDQMLFASGIWKFDDGTLSNIPHSVSIACNFNQDVCRKTVQHVETIKNRDYIDVDVIEFKIVRWTDKEIVAQFDWGFEKDSKSTLIVNLKEESIRMISPKTSPLKRSKIGHYTDNGVLMDGKDRTIDIGNKILSWSQ